MDTYLVQILRNKVLSGVELTDSEKRYLEKKYEQSEKDMFANWLANNR